MKDEMEFLCVHKQQFHIVNRMKTLCSWLISCAICLWFPFFSFITSVETAEVSVAWSIYYNTDVVDVISS